MCGGFIFAMRHNHTMSDAPGLVQFITAVAEIARGATSPSVRPVWQRHLLNARDPPRVTCSHPEFDEPEESPEPFPAEQFSHRAFFFGAAEISAIRRSLPPRQRGSSTFDVVAAYLWRTRVVALELDPRAVLHGVVNVNVKSKIAKPSPLPEGFYGNSFAFAAARATAGELAGEPLSHAVELVRKAKESVNEEFMRSMVDLVVKKGRARFPATRPYIMSDIRYAGFGDVDFGWGKPVYGGVAGAIPGVAGFIVRVKNGRGEEGVSVAVCLPKQAMERFEKLFDSLRLNSSSNFKTVEEYKLNIMSAL